MMAGGWLLAWHGSLQHETIHGHPTGIRAVDKAIGFVPLSMWLPYALYRRSHLAHHGSHAITDPHADPESRYVDRASGPAWLAARVQSTLIGHMLLGPPIAVVRFFHGELRRALAEPAQVARDWLPHLAGVVVLFAWLDHVGLGIGRYLLFFLYPGMALTMLRAHAEHGAELATASRAATVERGGVFALLFLNNNLHAAHHTRPQLAWYKLPGWHRQQREQWLREGATLYASYGEVARRFAVRGRGTPLHPSYRSRAA
jgi:fatty acid desaturase